MISSIYWRLQVCLGVLFHVAKEKGKEKDWDNSYFPKFNAAPYKESDCERLYKEALSLYVGGGIRKKVEEEGFDPDMYLEEIDFLFQMYHEAKQLVYF